MKERFILRELLWAQKIGDALPTLSIGVRGAPCYVMDSEILRRKTAQFVRSIKPDLLTIHFAPPYPGTKYYEAFLAQNMEIVSIRAQAEPASSPGVSCTQGC